MRKFIDQARIMAGSLAPMPENNTSPLNYVGGKAPVAENLWRMRPSVDSYTTIIDPFGGGASTPLTFARLGRDHKKKFRIRDMFIPTVNFWLVLRDSPWELASRVNDLLTQYPHGPDLFQACLDLILAGIDSGKDSVGAAAAYYIHVHVCVRQRQFYLTARDYSPKRGGEWIKSAMGMTGRLIVWGELIADWDIQRQDYKATMAEVIALGDEAFAFIDPPYETFDAMLYQCAFTSEDQDYLAELVDKASEGGAKSMVTINDSELNQTRYAKHNLILRNQSYASGTVGTELVVLTYESPFMTTMLAANKWWLAA